jgi:hypothetical protein
MWKFYLFFIPNILGNLDSQNLQQVIPLVQPDSVDYNYRQNRKHKKKKIHCKCFYLFINLMLTLGFIPLLVLISVNYVNAFMRDDLLHSHDADSKGINIIVSGFFCQALSICITTIEFGWAYLIRFLGQLYNIICSTIIFIGVLNESALRGLTGDYKETDLTHPISNLYFSISCTSILVLLMFQLLCVRKTPHIVL